MQRGRKNVLYTFPWLRIYMPKMNDEKTKKDPIVIAVVTKTE